MADNNCMNDNTKCLQVHKVYLVKVLVQLPAPTQKCWKKQKFNIHKTIIQKDKARILEMILKEKFA